MEANIHIGKPNTVSDSLFSITTGAFVVSPIGATLCYHPIGAMLRYRPAGIYPCRP
eukprot:CAMPEP_0172882262 /NCGR_PEP_ID=MMETSP1075-20121228/119646_1 /TAXON_ID=2916 /ORGANISM="Ceratium fusus, Strain PA161109" /LENGTH=55 /DNA_ID=CAMNT_0013734897 /DNA_START=215 /DNA_END=378 /DNA_ORIENTATION=+